MNYYRRYMADYLSKTASLSLLEHGAYCLLLDYAYLAAGKLPGDVQAIYRLVRALSPAERGAVDSVLEKHFELHEDHYENLRVMKEVERAQPAIDAARTNGVKGGRPKNNPLGSENETEQEPSAKASQPPTPRELQNTRALRSGLNGSFTNFWQTYPRRKSKGQAEKAWLRIRPDEVLAGRILQAVDRAKESPDWKRDGGKFIPYPATWLNAKGWEDEAPATPARGLAI